MFKTTAKSIAVATGESTADSEVLAIVRIIEDRIAVALGQKLSEVDVMLPTEFIGLKDLSRSDAQLIVYGRVLQELDLAGFTSKISIHETITTIKVKWRPALNSNLGQEMRMIIARHIDKPPAEEDAKEDGEKNKKSGKAKTTNDKIKSYH